MSMFIEFFFLCYAKYSAGFSVTVKNTHNFARSEREVPCVMF